MWSLYSKVKVLIMGIIHLSINFSAINTLYSNISGNNELKYQFDTWLINGQWRG